MGWGMNTQTGHYHQSMPSISRLILITGLSTLIACQSDPIGIERSDPGYQNLVLQNDQTDPSKNHNRSEIDANQSLVITSDHTMDLTGKENRQLVLSLRYQKTGIEQGYRIRDVDFGQVTVNAYRLDRFYSRYILPDSLSTGGTRDTIESVYYFSKVPVPKIPSLVTGSMMIQYSGSNLVSSGTESITISEPVRLSGVTNGAVIPVNQDLTIQLNQYTWPGYSGLYLFPAGLSSADSVVGSGQQAESMHINIRPTSRSKSITIPAAVLRRARDAHQSVFPGRELRFGLTAFGFQETSGKPLTFRLTDGSSLKVPVHLVSNHSIWILLKND